MMQSLSNCNVTLVAIAENAHEAPTNNSAVIADDSARLQTIVDCLQKVVAVRFRAGFEDEHALNPEITAKGNFRASRQEPCSQSLLVSERLVNAQPRKTGPRQWVYAI